MNWNELMNENHIGSLIVGLSGVVLGGVITFITEERIRRRNSVEEKRRDFTKSMADVVFAVEELLSIYSSLSKGLPEKEPTLILPFIQSYSPQYLHSSKVDSECLSSIFDKTDERAFSDTTLFLRRYNSDSQNFKLLGTKLEELIGRWRENGWFVYNYQNSVWDLSIPLEDLHSVRELVEMENRIRVYLSDLISSVYSGIDIVQRMNGISERKFPAKGKKKPPQLKDIRQFKCLEYLRKMPNIKIENFLPKAN